MRRLDRVQAFFFCAFGALGVIVVNEAFHQHPDCDIIPSEMAQDKKERESKKNRGLWQLVKFLIVGGIGAIIQLIVVNVLYFMMKDWKVALPAFISGIFNESVMGQGNSNWGYVLPFFISNLVANTYQYIQNKKTTFKADAPKWSFAVYFVVLVILIFVATWLQGILNHLFISTGRPFFVKLAPTLAVIFAGIVYTLVLFPLEKFVLFKEKTRV